MEAFRGADAVVLSLNFLSLSHHPALVEASIKAGVKRLVASTYGSNDENMIAMKYFPIAQTHHDTVMDLRSKNVPGWSWTSVSCGVFFDM